MSQKVASSRFELAYIAAAKLLFFSCQGGGEVVFMTEMMLDAEKIKKNLMKMQRYRSFWGT